MEGNQQSPPSPLSSLITTKLEELTQAAAEQNNDPNSSHVGLLHPHINDLNHNIGASTSVSLTDLQRFSSLLTTAAGGSPHPSLNDPFRPPQTPPSMARGSSKFGASGSGRSALAPSSGLRGPPGVIPPSALYTAVISPSEMAAHEATNFKNVKGVYKNCRGIWAAQWTDERGQRHTKYFNPKYYSTEAEARHEAFKFKVHIAREIELRGGVQKRRATPASVAAKIAAATASAVKGTESFMDVPYTRERQKRATRKASAKSRATRDPSLVDLYGAATGYCNPGFDSQWLRATDYLAAVGQQHHQTGSMGGLLQQHQQSKDYNLSQMMGAEDFDTSGLTNSSGSPMSAAPGSPQTTLFYNPQTFDTIFLPPASTGSTFSNQFLQNSSSGYASNQSAINSGYRVGNNDGSSSGQGQSSSSSSVNLNATLPPGTSFCLCGCGELAISPSRYASHHHTAIANSDQANAANEDQHSVTFDSNTASALFPITADFLADLQSSHNTQQQQTAADLLSTPLSSRIKRQADQSVDSLFEAHQESKRTARGILSSNNGMTGNTTDVGNGLDHARHHGHSSDTSFPFAESWMKSYSPYASYPTSNSQEQRQLFHHHSGNGHRHINEEDEASIAALLGQVTNSTNPDHHRQLREAAMLLLTSTGSSNGDGPPELSAGDEFGIDSQAPTTTSPSCMPTTGTEIVNSRHNNDNGGILQQNRSDGVASSLQQQEDHSFSTVQWMNDSTADLLTTANLS